MYPPAEHHRNRADNFQTILAPHLEDRLRSFETSTHSGAWRYLTKPDILQDLRSRLSDPYQLQQGSQPLCGPASVVFELVRKQPDRYIDICQSLYETGSFQGYTRQIFADPGLRHSHGNLRMAQLDWMLLATLRNAANLILPLHPQSPTLLRNLAGMTKTWEMRSWVRELLGYSETKTKHTYIQGEFKALQTAKTTIEAGGVAFALINAEGLLGSPSFLPATFYRIYPSHWVTILGNIAIESDLHQQGKIVFDIYSWGRKIRVNSSVKNIQNYLWGIVIGQNAER
jgi:hypothetical protein